MTTATAAAAPEPEPPHEPEPQPDPSPEVQRVIERLSPLVPKKPRHATQRDLLRVDEYFRLLDEGADPLTAGWRVLSDAKLGIKRWRGKSADARPDDIALAKRIANQLQRGVPELLASAKDATLARFSRVAESAFRVIEETMTGAFDDPAKARVQVEAAKVVIEAVGIGGARGGAVQTVQVNTAVALERDAESDLVNRMLQDPELLREVESLADKIESLRAGARRVEGHAGDGGAASEPRPVAPGPAPEPPVA